MSLYRLLQNLAAEPEEIRRMTAAYAQTLRAIGITDRCDPVAEMIAKKIIEITLQGSASRKAAE